MQRHGPSWSYYFLILPVLLDVWLDLWLDWDDWKMLHVNLQELFPLATTPGEDRSGGDTADVGRIFSDEKQFD